MMKLAPALLEDWLRDYYFTTQIDISSSGVENFSMADLRTLLGIGHDAIDQIVFNDSRSYGGPGLRQAIARRWANGDAERVMATHGSSEAIFLVTHALLQPGDEVIVLDPGYHSLCHIAESIGCQLKTWKLRFEDQYVPDIGALRQLLSPRTRMVIVNFPHNPTATSLSPQQQAELVAAVAEVDAYLVWDAAFGELTYDGTRVPDPRLDYQRLISFGTLSKGYGLAGLRVGWCIAEPEVLAHCITIRDYITLHLSPLVELIAQRAIEEGDRLLGPRLEQARHNLALLSDWVAEHQELVEWVPPKGGVIAFPRLRHVADVGEFCHRLTREHGVLLVPGYCFNAPQHVRLGFGGPTGEFREGMERFSYLLKQASGVDTIYLPAHGVPA
jgi:capreomycidine synthase